jgi:hypothetical protein
MAIYRVFYVGRGLFEDQEFTTEMDAKKQVEKQMWIAIVYKNDERIRYYNPLFGYRKYTR